MDAIGIGFQRLPGRRALVSDDELESSDDGGGGAPIEGMQAAFAAMPDAQRPNHKVRKLPTGVLVRSSAHTFIMREAKRLRKLESTHQGLRNSLNHLGNAWNEEMGLRHGDRVQHVGENWEPNFHPNTWSHDGLVKTA